MVITNTMKGLITGTQKRQYETSEAEDIKLNIADNQGDISFLDFHHIFDIGFLN